MESLNETEIIDEFPSYSKIKDIMFIITIIEKNDKYMHEFHKAILNRYYNILRKRWLVKRIIYKWIVYKNKSKLYVNITDLSLNVRPTFSPYIIDIIHCNKRWWFTVSDMINHLKSCLLFCDYGHYYPRSPYNPYNNKLFKIQHLIEIYKVINKFYHNHKQNIDFILHCFEKSLFDIKQFERLFSSNLKYSAITHYVNGLNDSEFYSQICEYFITSQIISLICPVCLSQYKNLKSQFKSTLVDIYCNTDNQEMIRTDAMILLRKSSLLYKCQHAITYVDSTPIRNVNTYVRRRLSI